MPLQPQEIEAGSAYRVIATTDSDWLRPGVPTTTCLSAPPPTSRRRAV